MSSSSFLDSLKSSWDTTPPLYKHAVCIVLAVFAIALLAKLFERDIAPPEVQDHVKDLIANASSMLAICKQDKVPLVAYMHVNYALANARNAQRALKSEDEIYRLTGVRLNEFIDVLEKTQAAIAQDIGKTCPSLKPTTLFSGSSGWI